jgi:hypothetical protein
MEIVIPNKQEASSAGRRIARRGGVLHQQNGVDGPPVAESGEVDRRLLDPLRNQHEKLLAARQELRPAQGQHSAAALEQRSSHFDACGDSTGRRHGVQT